MQDNQTQTQNKGSFKKYRNLIIIGAILIAVIVLLSESLFVVGEATQAVVSRFGIITRIILNNENDFHTRYADALSGETTMNGQVSIVHSSGLQFKMPFVDRVETYSSRLYTYVSEAETVNTSEKKQYLVSTYAQWRITDPALFSLKLGSMRAAENTLDNLIHPVIVQSINRMTAEDFVSNKDALNEALRLGLVTINQDMCIRGIEVVDIQIPCTTLPTANLETTYARMKADRAKEATRLRSEGEETYQLAVAAADLEARKLEADAVSTAGTTKAEAEAEALRIFAEAYGVDPEFYQFWRSLQALRDSFSSKATLVLSQDHPLVRDLLSWGLSEDAQ